MNIFVLSPDPLVAATMHCDKHVVKMIVEYAQLLSTAHRILDGNPIQVSVGKRERTVRLLPGETFSIGTKESGAPVVLIENRVCYNTTHANHPSAVWARETGANYWWLFRLFSGCLAEYTRRYGKTHASAVLVDFFQFTPKNMEYGTLTPFPQAMPPEYQVPNDPISAYRAFYVGSKARFAKWTNAHVPTWFTDAITEKGLNVADFIRTR